MQIIIALRFYATDTFQRVTGDSFGVSLSVIVVVGIYSRETRVSVSPRKVPPATLNFPRVFCPVVVNVHKCVEHQIPSFSVWSEEARQRGRVYNLIRDSNLEAHDAEGNVFNRPAPPPPPPHTHTDTHIWTIQKVRKPKTRNRSEGKIMSPLHSYEVTSWLKPPNVTRAQKADFSCCTSLCSTPPNLTPAL